MERLARNQSQYSVYEAFAKQLFIPDTERSLREVVCVWVGECKDSSR